MQNQINYNCKQEELYKVAYLGWHNYKDNLPDFTNHKDKYTTALGDVAIAALLRAQKLPDHTSPKITANNEVYDFLIQMFADGQLIYKNDPVKKALFVFGTLLSYISAPKHAGLRIVAKEKNTELPVAGFSVTAQPGNVRGLTDENGVLILSLSENSYSITGIKDGYETFAEEVNITTGIIYRKDVALTKSA